MKFERSVPKLISGEVFLLKLWILSRFVENQKVMSGKWVKLVTKQSSVIGRFGAECLSPYRRESTAESFSFQFHQCGNFGW